MQANPKLPVEVLTIIFESLLKPLSPCRRVYDEEKKRVREARKLCSVNKSTAVVAKRMLFRRVALQNYEMAERLATEFVSKPHQFRYIRDLRLDRVSSDPFPFDAGEFFKAIGSLDVLVIHGKWTDVFKHITSDFPLRTLTIVRPNKGCFPDFTHLEVKCLNFLRPTDGFLTRLQASVLDGDASVASNIAKIRAIPRIGFTLIEYSEFEVEVLSALFKDQSQNPSDASLWVKSYWLFILQAYYPTRRCNCRWDGRFDPYEFLESPMRATYIDPQHFDKEAPSIDVDIYCVEEKWDYVAYKLGRAYVPAKERNIVIDESSDHFF